MAFLGFGKKNIIKKPLTGPLGEESSNNMAELPPLDSSFPEDKGLPDTPSLNPGNDFPGITEKQKKYSMPDFNEESNSINPSFHQNSYQQPNKSHTTVEKELELISSKLDYLKSAIDNLSQRLGNLENLAKSEQEQRYKW